MQKYKQELWTLNFYLADILCKVNVDIKDAWTEAGSDGYNVWNV